MRVIPGSIIVIKHLKCAFGCRVLIKIIWKIARNVVILDYGLFCVVVNFSIVVMSYFFATRFSWGGINIYYRIVNIISSIQNDFIRQQIEELILESMNLGGEAAEQFARGVFTMTKLQELEMSKVTLHNEFFSVMSESALQSQVDLAVSSPSFPLHLDVARYIYIHTDNGTAWGGQQNKWAPQFRSLHVALRRPCLS